MASLNRTVGLGATGALLPITGSFVAPFAAYYIYLSVGVVLSRQSTHTLLGDGGNASSSAATSNESPVAKKDTSKTKYTTLQRAIRAQGNFAENVPLALVLAAIAELNGANGKYLIGALSTLFAARVAHAELGVKAADTAVAAGRPAGFLATAGVIAYLAGYSAYLSKGYWGY